MKAITYYRVSTQKQGVNGLGMEAQQNAVNIFNRGREYDIIAEYIEVESGKNHLNRPQLDAALRHCEKSKAILLIAKLDRLSRDVEFIAHILKSKVQIKCMDMPEADKTMLQMMAVFAERERDMISKRTIEALAAAKARGVKLGSPDVKRLAQQNRDAALYRWMDQTPYIMELHAKGAGVRAIGREVNINPMTVSRIIRRNQPDIA